VSTSGSRNTALSALTILVFVAVGVYLWIGSSLQAAMDRGTIPGLEDEPFYPPADPVADAILAVARDALDREVAGIRAEAAAKAAVEEAAKAAESSPSEDGGAEDSSGGSADSVAGAGAGDTPNGAETGGTEAVTPPNDASDFPQLGQVADHPWVVSLYLPTRNEDARGPHVRRLPDADVRVAVDSLLDALPSAARAPDVLAGGRWKVDRILPGRRPLPPKGGYGGVALDAGIDGIELTHPDAGAPFWYLPSWSAERETKRRRIYSSAIKAARADGWSKSNTNEASVSAFRTRAYVEALGGGATARPTQRGNAVGRPSTVPEIRRSIEIAADYLVRETDGRGKFTYRYNAYADKNDGGYNMLRHAGTAYSMFQAYRLVGDEAIYDAAARAMDYYRRRMKEDEDRPGEWFILDGGGSRKRAKLGGAGLGLLAYVEMEKAKPGSSDYEAMLGLARHIEHMQQDDGSFESFYNWDGKEKTTRKSTFYPGEATLALVRLHQLTGDERWLDVAERAADYYVDKRWVSLGLRIYIPPDAWGLQALEELDRVRPNSRREKYALAVSESIARHKLMDPEVTPPDMVGGDLSGLGSLPLAANSGSYGEALTAGARLEARRRPGETRHQEHAQTNLTMQLRNQFTEANDWFLPNPTRAHGGFRFKPNNHEIGNDVVQHNISGLMGILQLMDPDAPNIGLVVSDAERSAPLKAAMEAAQ